MNRAPERLLDSRRRSAQPHNERHVAACPLGGQGIEARFFRQIHGRCSRCGERGVAHVADDADDRVPRSDVADRSEAMSQRVRSGRISPVLNREAAADDRLVFAAPDVRRVECSSSDDRNPHRAEVSIAGHGDRIIGRQSAARNGGVFDPDDSPRLRAFQRRLGHDARRQNAGCERQSIERLAIKPRDVGGCPIARARRRCPERHDAACVEPRPYVEYPQHASAQHSGSAQKYERQRDLHDHERRTHALRHSAGCAGATTVTQYAYRVG